MHGRSKTGFTIAELLITLAVIAVVAVYSIPKILQTSGGNVRHKAAADGVAQMVQSAYQAYLFNNSPVQSTFGFNSLLPYLNYLKADTTSAIDSLYNEPTLGATYNCGDYTGQCLLLHNGGAIIFWTHDTFGGTATTNAIPFMFDPDFRKNSTSTTGEGKGVAFYLYTDGRIRERSAVDSNTTYSNGAAVVMNPSSSYTPPWYTTN